MATSPDKPTNVTKKKKEEESGSLFAMFFSGQVCTVPLADECFHRALFTAPFFTVGVDKVDGRAPCSEQSNLSGRLRK